MDIKIVNDELVIGVISQGIEDLVEMAKIYEYYNVHTPPKSGIRVLSHYITRKTPNDVINVLHTVIHKELREFTYTIDLLSCFVNTEYVMDRVFDIIKEEYPSFYQRYIADITYLIKYSKDRR